MARMLFGKGARGELVRKAQSKLKQQGVYQEDVDGDYGGLTEKAVVAFRKRAKLGAEPTIDLPTWKQLTGEPLPGVRDRALQLTASFEGHGFTLAQGNFDGAGLTWGVIGFTLKYGKVQKLVLAAAARNEGLVELAFGKNATELIHVMKAPLAQQLAWADKLSLGASKARLAEPWRSAFARFGELPEVQALQLREVDASYFQPARRTAKGLGLTTELGLALCFDIHVQNGGIGTKAAAEIAKQRAAHPIHDERELRAIVAHAVAHASNPTYQQDVLSRKLAFATGAGTVHGRTYVLSNWGLAEVAAKA